MSNFAAEYAEDNKGYGQLAGVEPAWRGATVNGGTTTTIGTGLGRRQGGRTTGREAGHEG